MKDDTVMKEHLEKIEALCPECGSEKGRKDCCYDRKQERWWNTCVCGYHYPQPKQEQL